MRGKVIGYLKLSYVLWKENGGCSNTCFSAIMDVFFVSFSGENDCTVYNELFLSVLCKYERVIGYLELSYTV